MPSTARRLVAALVLVLVLALGAAGCGSADDESPAPAAKAETGVFPVTVTHRFGTTTVTAKPTRIAVVGLTEQDILLALGEKPVATTEWYGDQPHAVWPWARPALGDAKPAVLENTDGFQFERIAALRPDLIVGTNSGMKRADYRKLSAIAPTIASVRGGTDYFSRWDEQTVTVAKAIGKEAAGRALVKRIKDAYAKAAAEQLPILDSDVIVFATEKPSDIPALMKVKLFRWIPAIAEKRAVFTARRSAARCTSSAR